MSSVFFDSPNRNSPIKDVNYDKLKTNPRKRSIFLPNNIESSSSHPDQPSRLFLQNHLSTNTLPTKERPILKPPIANLRSKSSIPTFSRPKTSLSFFNAVGGSPKHKLRRTNSLISQGASSNTSDGQLQSATTSSDRFIPSHKNANTGRLHTNTTNPLPNASPQTHIKAQTSKIYQHHVAEACGLEVNSRILSYRPLPPERNKPINLFTSKTKVMNNANKLKTLRPAAASARAKKIPTAPERVLDAPGLIDDFYLNLLAWSLTNLLAIGLEDTVYVWNASTGSVGLLCELPDKMLVTSLKWSEDGSYISIGRDDGLTEIWDIETNTKLRTLNCDNHQTRIASQAWYLHILTSGSKIGSIYQSDVRVSNHLVNKLENTHLAEICGIEYKSDGQQFATGGNDNLVCLWDIKKTHNNDTSAPLFVKTNHKAAVKALSWCPYQPNLLATGGGTSDKTINFWNTATGARTNTIETGSQISSLNWGYANGIGMEIVATHGYPTNNISLFNYPTLQKTGEIIAAHDSRILNGCLSPDGLTLATVAGDENLKFWSLFDLYKHSREGDRIDGDEGTEGNDKLKKLMNIR